MPASQRKHLLCVCTPLACRHMLYSMCLFCVRVHSCRGRVCRTFSCTHAYMSIFVFACALGRLAFFFASVHVPCKVTEAAVFLLLCLCVALASEYRRAYTSRLCLSGGLTYVQAAAMKERLCSRGLPITPRLVERGGEDVQDSLNFFKRGENADICSLSWPVLSDDKAEKAKTQKAHHWLRQQTREWGFGWLWRFTGS